MREHRGEYPSEWVAIYSIAGKFGVSREDLRNWVHQSDPNPRVVGRHAS